MFTCMRGGHHEVAAPIADQTFDFTLVIAFAGAIISIPDHIMRQHRAEPLCSLAFAIWHDLRDQAAVIVVEHRLRHRVKERKRVNMPI